MMKYRKKRENWKKRDLRKKSRYADFVERLAREEAELTARLKAEAELKEARLNLLLSLYEIREQKENEYWDDMKKLLSEMKKELEELGPVPSRMRPVEVIHFCVDLFGVTSKYQDIIGKGIEVAPTELKESVSHFNNNLYYTGRHEHWDKRSDDIYETVPYWNTTKKGEPITLDNICFGPDLGFQQKSARFWLSLSKKKKVSLTIDTRINGKTIFSKPTKSVWVTEFLVHKGIHHFCKKAVEALSENFKELGIV